MQIILTLPDNDISPIYYAQALGLGIEAMSKAGNYGDSKDRLLCLKSAIQAEIDKQHGIEPSPQGPVQEIILLPKEITLEEVDRALGVAKEILPTASHTRSNVYGKDAEILGKVRTAVQAEIAKQNGVK